MADPNVQQLGTEPWEELSKIIASGNGEHLEAFLRLLPPGDIPYNLARLDEDEQTRMLGLIDPEVAAELMLYLSDEYAADLIEELRPQQAAAIVDELDSDDQADILLELDDDDQEAILAAMDPQEAEDARRLIEYDPQTAGGIMFTEYFAYPVDSRVDDIIDDMQQQAEEHEDLDFHYTYLIDDQKKLVGVLPMRHLLLSRRDRAISDMMIREPERVPVLATLEELEDVFDRFDRIVALPVVDEADRLVGVVAREAVEEALGERAEEALQAFGGIVRGEELRTQPVLERSLKRLAYLVPMIGLMIVSISVIAVFEKSVLEKVTPLAVFLPLVAGLCGCSGNQSLAVSIRELSLGLAKTGDVLRVLRQEVGLGIVTGLCLGVCVFGITTVWAYLAGWTGGVWLGLVVGGSMPLTIVFAVVLGGVVPLILRRFNVDPAMAAGPIITTCVDFFGFFTVLAVALLVIQKLT